MGHQLSSSHIKSPCFELVFPRSAALCLPAAASRSHQRSWPRATLELSELEVLLLLMHSASAKRHPRTSGSERKSRQNSRLREKIKNAQAHMKELESYIDETMKTSGSGGEKN